MIDPTRIKELRKEIESLCGNCDRPDKEQLGEIILSSMALGFNVGLKAPSADRPQGEWIKDENGDYRCSNCGGCEEQYIYGTENWYGRGESKFCPSCGARMKGSDDD